MSLLLDTHVLVWWLASSDRLSRAQVARLEAAERAAEPLAVSAISLWELAKLVERGRLELETSIDTVLSAIEEHERIRIVAIDARVALESTRLGSASLRDPADQLIVATARLRGLELVTADRVIRASRLVTVV